MISTFSHKTRLFSFCALISLVAIESKAHDPFEHTAISQYSCFTNALVDSSGSTFDLTQASRSHFYHPSYIAPPAVAPGVWPSIYCHDVETTGSLVDSPLYPRLETVSGQFRLWNDQKMVNVFDDYTDVSTGLDLDNNGINDALDSIVESFGLSGQLITPSKAQRFFTAIKWPRGPGISGGLGNGDFTEDTNPVLGYMLRPFVDNSGSDFCPSFNSMNAISVGLREVIGDTEALYLAKRDIETYVDDYGITQVFPDNYIFITESELREISFYLESDSSRHLVASVQDTYKRNFFHWPRNQVSPLVKTSDQNTYMIVSPTSAGSKDSRIGCVPKSF